MEVDTEECTEEILSKKLQLRAAEMLIRLKDECYSTIKVFTLVTKGVDELYNILLSIIKSKFIALGSKTILSVEEVCSILKEYEGNTLFEGVRGPEDLSNFIKQQRSLVRPEIVEITTKNVLANGKVVKLAVETGCYIPFRAMLECLLNCPEVLHCIDNPKPVVEDQFNNPLDGYAYRNHPIVKKYPNTLAIRTYDDDAQCTDTASSQNVSVRLGYWTLLNTYPELRSSNQAIHLLYCVKTDLIKTNGHKSFIEDFVNDMKKLCSENGVVLNIMGQQRTFRAVLVDHNGDNPASASIGGFKESHFAHCPCRQCHATSENMYNSFNENYYTRRSKDTHEIQVAEVEKFIESGSKEKFGPSVQYGINNRSPLMEIPNCDVTKILPQDLLHDVILGTVKQEIVCLLQHVLNKKSTTLKAINKKVGDLAKFFGVNKPAPIHKDHLDNKKLRQSGSETLALAHLLPFALTKKTTDNTVESLCDKENMNCYILRLELLKFEMSDQFSKLDVERLRKMIEDHHTRFQKLYPNEEIPKMHYETHLPTQILLFGPLRTHWCFRFEGKHAYFKRLCRLIHNYNEICFALALRHQEKQCGLMLLSSIGKEYIPYLRSSDETGVARPVIIAETSHVELLSNFFGLEPNSIIQQHSFAHVKGVHYSKESAIALKFINDVPKCGEIVAIYKHKESLAFVYTPLRTEKYEVPLAAFKVRFTNKLGIINASELPYRHHIPFIREVGANYIIFTSKSYLSRLY